MSGIAWFVTICALIGVAMAMVFIDALVDVTPSLPKRSDRPRTPLGQAVAGWIRENDHAPD